MTRQRSDAHLTPLARGLAILLVASLGLLSLVGGVAAALATTHADTAMLLRPVYALFAVLFTACGADLLWIALRQVVRWVRGNAG